MLIKLASVWFCTMHGMMPKFGLHASGLCSIHAALNPLRNRAACVCYCICCCAAIKVYLNDGDKEADYIIKVR